MKTRAQVNVNRVLWWEDRANFFSQCWISKWYHRSIVTIKIFPLDFLFLFDWWMKRWEITKEVSMNCSGLNLLHYGNGQIHAYMTASSIKKHNVFAVYQFKSAKMVSCLDLYVFSWAVICQYSCFFVQTLLLTSAWQQA